MKKEIIKRLEKEKLDFWKLEVAEIEMKNIYFEKDEEESYISGKRTDYLVTVYKKIGEKIGEASVTIKEKSEINEKIKEVIAAAKLIKNPYYTPFEKYSNYPKLKKAKELPSYEEIKKKVREAYDEIKKTDAKLNALEVFTKKSKINVTTSIGQELSEEHNSAYAECVVTVKGKRGEMEYVPMRSESNLNQIDLRSFVKNCYINAKDISNSTSPRMFRGKVILSGDALAEFIVPTIHENPIIIHSSAKMKYLNISKLELGKNFEKIKADKITMKSNPLIEGGLRNSAFDSNLVPARELDIIKDGVFTNFFASKRYADYLKIKPTGPLGNIELGTGKISADEFYKDGVCEIVGFSSFAPNIYSGDFTAEIRLGYYIKDGKKTPFKGGMLVGNYFKLMANVVLSKEKFFKSGYYGPKAIMFNDAVISGL